jgi:hypothetical protein
MERVNFPMTIDELIAEALKAKKKFGGNKYVLVSDDEEGNGYHECYFSFGNAKDLAGCYCSVPGDLELEDCVTLG